jgi:hypothetical protein
MKAKFISRGKRFGAGPNLYITNKGYETRDPAEIAYLRSLPDLGKLFFEIPTDDEIKQSVIAQAKRYLAEEGQSLEPVPVAPMEKPNLEEERIALEQEMAAREEDKRLEELTREVRAEKVQEIAKRAGRPKKGV